MTRMGFPSCLGEAVADNLRTEKPMSRMIGYLLSAGPRSEEEIVDEMLAISAEAQTWRERKESQEAQASYTAYLFERRMREEEYE